MPMFRARMPTRRGSGWRVILSPEILVDQYLPIVEALEKRVVELQPHHLPEPLLGECDSLRF